MGYIDSLNTGLINKIFIDKYGFIYNSLNGAIVKYDKNGNLITSFGTDGKLTTTSYNDFIVDNDGIYTIYDAKYGTYVAYFSKKYNQNGIMDTSYSYVSKNSNSDKGNEYGFKIYSNNGFIYIVGETFDLSSYGRKATVAKINKTNGSVISKISKDNKSGSHTTTITSSVMNTTNSEIYISTISSYLSGSNPSNVFIKIKSDMTIDSDFNPTSFTGNIIYGNYVYEFTGDKVASYTFSGTKTNEFTTNSYTDFSIFNDKIYLLTSNSLVRYNLNGTLDTTFGSNGTITLDHAYKYMRFNNDGELYLFSDNRIGKMK